MRSPWFTLLPTFILIFSFTLSALAKEQLVGCEEAEKAIKKYKIDKEKEFPANL